MADEEKQQNSPNGPTGRATGPKYDHLYGDSMESLTLEELDEFMRRTKARAAHLREAQRRALQKRGRDEPVVEEPVVEEPVGLSPGQVTRLARAFFPELPAGVRPRRLLQGVVFDFDNTLARLKRPLPDLMEEGARQAEAYMRSTGMDELPEDFWKSIVEARLFAQTKSDDEQEEHIADDTLSFLLQFFGYPASQMDMAVLRRAVDLFYAPEMVAWEPMPGAHELLRWLNDEGRPVAVIANYPCDRVFQRTVDYTGLRPYLDVCLSSAAVEWRKPARDIYDVVLERWDVEPYEIACVGDSLQHDVAGGQELGALTVHCRMIPLAEDRRIVEAVVPDAVIDDLRQLPALIRAWS